MLEHCVPCVGGTRLNSQYQTHRGISLGGKVDFNSIEQGSES